MKQSTSMNHYVIQDPKDDETFFPPITIRFKGSIRVLKAAVAREAANIRSIEAHNLVMQTSYKTMEALWKVRIDQR